MLECSPYHPILHSTVTQCADDERGKFMSESPIVTFDFCIKAFIAKHISLCGRAASLLAIILAAAVVGASACLDTVQSKYRIPRGYVGWVRIYYDVEGAPPLPIENDVTIYDVPANGRLVTLNSQPTNQTSEFFYYGKRRETRILNPQEVMHGFGSGARVKPLIIGEGQRTRSDETDQEGLSFSYEEFFVGTEKQYAKARCHSLQFVLEDEIRKDLRGFIKSPERRRKNRRRGRKTTASANRKGAPVTREE